MRRLCAVAVALAGPLGLATPTYATFGALSKVALGPTTSIAAGSAIGYEIQVPITAVCAAGDNATNVVVEDVLPTDAYGNQLTSFVSADCQRFNTADSVSPACLGGTATEARPGVMRWVFPGKSCPVAGTARLTMHIYVKVKANVEDGQMINNAAVATDDEGKTGSVLNTAVTTKSSKLEIRRTTTCGGGGAQTGRVCATPTDDTDCTGAGGHCEAADGICVGGTLDASPCATAVDASACIAGGGVCTTVQGQLAVDIGATPAFQLASIEGNKQVQYRFFLRNGGTRDAKGVLIQVLLPFGESYVPDTATPNGFPDACRVCGSFAGGVLSWQYDALHPSQVLPFDYRVEINSGLAAGAILFNIATAVDAAGHAATGTHTLTAQSPCLQLAKRVRDCRHASSCGDSDLCYGVTATEIGADNPLAAPGPTDIVTYEFDLTNNGAAGCSTATGVTIADTIPTGMTFVGCTGGTSCTSDGAAVTFTLPDLAPGASAAPVQLKLKVDQSTSGDLVNTATAKSSNLGAAAFSRTISVHPPILNMTQTASPNPIEPGGTLKYAVLLSNTGINCASDVRVEDRLPTNAPYVAGSLGEFSAGCGTPEPSALFAADMQRFLLSPFDLPSATSCSFAYQVQVPEHTALGGSVVSQVNAVDHAGVETTTSAEATSTTSVNTRLIELTKSATGCTKNGAPCDPEHPPAGAELDYTITAGAGPLVATNVKVTDTLPTHPNTADPPAPVTSYRGTTCPSPRLQGGVLECRLGDIPQNTSKSFHVTVLVTPSNPAGTIIVNTATASDDGMDVLRASVSVGVEVVMPTPTPSPTPKPVPKLVAMTSATGRPRRGGNVILTMLVVNNGDAPATHVVLSDTFPKPPPSANGFRLLTIPEWCTGKVRDAAFSCDLGDLPPGGISPPVSVLTRVRLRGVRPGDVITNTANITSDQVQTQATVSLTVVGRRRASAAPTRVLADQ